MAKKALLGVLERTIGKYVVDLDAEKLNLGIWSGQVELHDLQLDVDKCNAELDRQAAEAPNLAVPLRVVGGQFASVKLAIPWTSLSSKSVEVTAHGLHIRVAPHDRLTQNDFLKHYMESEEKRAAKIKEARIQSIQLADENRHQTNELMKLTQLSQEDVQNKANVNAADSEGFVARLVKRIVENLQVDIKDVQVTLEGAAIGTAGLMLENLSFVTTDMGGHRTFVDRTSNDNPSDLLNKFLYKKLNIQGVALYVDEPDGNSNSDDNGDDTRQHSYILDPLTLEAKAREADASITKEYPKYLLKSTMPSVQLGLSQRQYQQTMQLVAAMAPSPHAARPLFPEYRPLKRVSKESVKDWWQYAFRCVSRLNGRRAWVIFIESFQARKKYVPLYKRQAHADKCPWMTPLTKEETDELQSIEADRTISIEGIMMWRNLADAQADMERQKREEQKPGGEANDTNKKKGGFMSNLFGGKSGDSGEDDQDTTPINLSTEELKELENVGMEQIGYGQELDNESKLCRVEFVLGEFKVHLSNGDNKPMLGLDMGTVSTLFDADKGGSFSFGYTLQSLEVSDHLYASSVFPKILSPLESQTFETAHEEIKEEEEEEPAFRVHMAKAKNGDKKLTVKLVPFEVVVAPHLLSEIMGFIRVPEMDHVQALQSSGPDIEEIKGTEETDEGEEKNETPSTSSQYYSEYSEDISNALVEAWMEKTREKTSLSIDLDVKAPILVLPENCSNPSASVLVLDLGGFRFQYGFSDPTEKATQWLKDNPRDADSYNLTNQSDESSQASGSSSTGVVVDHGRLELENMTFLVVEADKWRKIASDEDGMTVHSRDEAIIEPITVRFDFAVESVVASSLPRACIFANIPTSNFKFSPNHLSMTLQVYNAWMNSLESVRSITATTPDSPSPSSSKPPALEATAASAPVMDVSLSGKEREQMPARSNGEAVAVEIDNVANAVETSLGNDASLFTTMHFEFTTEKYSFVVYDSGFQSSQNFNVKNSQSGQMSPLTNVAEGLVMEGGVSLSVEMATDKTGQTSSIETEIKGQDFQVYSAFGRELRRPLQILEPVTGTLKVGLISQGVRTKKADLKARCNNEIDLTFSMRNLALVNTISAEVSQCLENSLKKAADAETIEMLDEEKEHEIEAMAAALEEENKENTMASNQSQEVQLPVPEKSRANDVLNPENASSTILSINVKVPRTKLTIINDLQGLDEALFRVQMEEVVNRSMVANMQDLKNTMLTQTTFNVKFHSKILADYYDPSINQWNPLLKEPWEIAFKGERSADKGAKSDGRYSTKTDIHFKPIYLSFSEHFLIGLGSASRMFAMSSEMEKERFESISQGNEEETTNDASIRQNASNRNLVAALPYALDNYSGMDVEYLLAESRIGNRSCPNGSKQYFKFNPPKGKGRGGKRQYGQDVMFDLSIKIFLGGNTIEIKRIDDKLGKPKECHVLDDGTLIVTTVVKEGKSTVIRLSSNTSIQNRTPIPMSIGIHHAATDFDIGVCQPASTLLDSSKQRLVPYDVRDGTLSKSSRRMGLRFSRMGEIVKEWAAKGKGSATIVISPHLEGSRSDLQGKLQLEVDLKSMLQAEHNTMRYRVDVVCASGNPEVHDFVFQAAVKLQLIQGAKLVISISLEPRAQLVNTMPVSITVLTRVPNCYSAHTLGQQDRTDKVHDLEPGEKMEVYASGENLAVKVRCSEPPCRGTPVGTTRQWLQIPMTSPLEKPMLCLLPFVTEEDLLSSSSTPGSEFFIAEANNTLPSFFLERINDDGNMPEFFGFGGGGKDDEGDELEQGNSTIASSHISKTFLFTVGNYGVDHTKSVLFEQLVSKSKGMFRNSGSKKPPLPFGTFTDETSQRQVSLLPTSEIPLRLAKPGEKTRWTANFRVEEVSMSEGGAQATPILWDDGSDSGYCAYRKLVSSFQSELHIIPEFLVFNGDPRHRVVVKQKNGPDVEIAPKEAAPVFAVAKNKGLFLSFHYIDIGGSTKSLKLNDLALHIELVKTAEGSSLGSLAVQTSIGTTDSRLLVKLGEVGEIEREHAKTPMSFLPEKFNDDNMRFRLQAEKLTITLNEAVFVDLDTDGQGSIVKASDASKSTSGRPGLTKSPTDTNPQTTDASKSNTTERPGLSKSQTDHSHIHGSLYKRTETPICTFVMENVVYDLQKLFKPKEELNENEMPERCQLSLVVHDCQIRDETPDSPFPIVFDCRGKNRFIDFCVRSKGPLYARNVQIDLCDLLLAHTGVGENQSGDKLYLQTSETFIWKLIDLADLIIHAIAEGAQPTDGGDLDKNLEAFIPAYSSYETVQHTAPQVATIYKMSKARVSPFSLVVSFKRKPDAQRYERFVNNQGAHLMRYFTQQLKFTIDKCELQFARYEESNLKGPLDRLSEILTAVYVSRTKLKAVTILAASTFGDWKTLSARDGGDDEFVDGDVLRATGALAGNSVAYAFNKAGKGISKGVTVGFDAIGGGVENGAALLGARDFGAGVRTVVSGVGGGIGGTFTGVGEGAGNLFKGAGEGLGHFFGGITGGGSTIAKGVGKSITTGDGRALASGFKDGVGHMGKGIRSSVKAVGSGVGGAATSIATGSVKGVRSSVSSQNSRQSVKKQQRDLQKIREEFQNQDYS